MVDNTETLDDTRVMLTCVLPLNEILVDFNDKLKSITRGYGSMDYEHCGYQPAKLVRMDIMIARRAGRRLLDHRAPRQGRERGRRSPPSSRT
jgi:translation elongation factor EF-4